MDAWTKKPHYPLVTVEEVTESGGKTKVKVNQEIFLLNNDGAKDTLWQVPIMAFGSDGSGKSPCGTTARGTAQTLILWFLLLVSREIFQTGSECRTDILKVSKGSLGCRLWKA